MNTFFSLFFAIVLWVVPGVAQGQSWQVDTVVAPPPIEVPLVPEGWTTVPGSYLRLHGPLDRTALLLRLARHGSDALPRLSEALDVPIGKTIHVFVADTQVRFAELQPGSAPTWADATAYPSIGAVFLRDPSLRLGNDEPLEQVFDHELVHILLGRAFAPAVPPSWLQEGVAQVLAGQAGPQTARTLGSAGTQGGLVSLDSLARGFPADPVRARLAYAQSADFVQYLQGTYGEAVVPTLVHASLEGAEFRGAVRQATGAFLDDVEVDWRSRWPRHEGTLAGILADLGSWVFGIGAIALLVGGVLRRRRFHRRLEEMGREEALLDQLVSAMRARR